MKKSKLALAVAAMACLISVEAGAQDLKTGYFLDNYLYGYRLNPASQVEENTDAFFGVLINNVAVGINSDLGLSNILFPVNGDLVTGFNQNVPAEQFLEGLKISNKINADINENLFAFGARTKSGLGFWTVEANLKSFSTLAAPMSVFEYLKVGASDNVYNIRDFDFDTKNYAELVLGYSRKIGDRMTIGAAVKGIVGLGYARMSIDNLAINTREMPARADGKGYFVSAMPMYKFSKTQEGYIDLGTFDSKGFGIAGFGAGIDLGMTYEAIDGLTLSAAILDLGAVAWKKDVSGQLGNYSFNILENTNLEDNLEDMLRFKYEEGSGYELDMLNFQVNFGAKYVIPNAEKLTVGALYSFRLGDSFSKYIDFRAGVTYTPSKVFSISGSAGVNNYGTVLGAAMNLNAGPVNFFAGIDGIFVRVTPQFVPINPLSTVLKTGLSIRL